MLIPIRSNYHDNGRIYSKNEVDLKPGLTVLVGCNGSGKTTLLHQIEAWCKKNDVPSYKYDNYTQGGTTMNSSLCFFGHMDELIQNAISSEGEQISNNMAYIAGRIGNFIHNECMRDGYRKAVILLDAIDSGLSIDNVIDFKEDLVKTILEDCRQNDFEVYLVVVANEYEMARGEQCLNMCDLQYVSLPTYDDYRKLIIKSRKRKNKRYKWGEWNGTA